MVESSINPTVEESKDIVLGDVSLTLCNEMIQRVNDELNITFTSVANIKDIENALVTQISAIAYMEEDYVGYDILKEFGFKIDNTGAKVYHAVLEKAEQDVITQGMQYAIQYANKNMSDTEALKCIESFPMFELKHAYEIGDRFEFQGKLYKALKAHESSTEHMPNKDNTLYKQL